MTTEPLCLEPSCRRRPDQRCRSQRKALDPQLRDAGACAEHHQRIRPGNRGLSRLLPEPFHSGAKRITRSDRAICGRSAAAASCPRQCRAHRLGPGLANATLQQRLTAVRLFFGFLVDEGLMRTNPVGRGRYALSRGFGGRAERPLIQKFHKLPWIPSEEQWASILAVVSRQPIPIAACWHSPTMRRFGAKSSVNFVARIWTRHTECCASVRIRPKAGANASFRIQPSRARC